MTRRLWRSVRARHAVIFFVVACVGFGLPSRVAHGQTLTQESKLLQAKEMFRRGVALLNAGDTGPALVQFLHSRELLPSGKNTVNAAICLERLGRYDEALELYQEVVARFADDLAPEDRENLAPVITSLGAKIGHLKLSANTAGLVMVAGRPRGILPFNSALAILPGPQTIRISKDGYQTFESTVELQAGETQWLEVHLNPMSARLASSLANAESASRGRERRDRVRPRPCSWARTWAGSMRRARVRG